MKPVMVLLAAAALLSAANVEIGNAPWNYRGFPFGC